MTVFDNFRTILDQNEHVIQTAARRFCVDVALGKYKGISHVRKFGAATVPTAFVTIWEDNSLYSYVTSATTMTVSSTSANDTAAGTGAQTIEFFGNDTDFNQVSDTVSMAGQAPVTLTPDLLRVWRARVRTAGSLATNEGTIYIGDGTVTAGVPANIRAVVSPSNGQTLMCVYTVPAGKTAVIVSKVFSVGRAKDCTFRLFTRKFGELFLIREQMGLFQATFKHEFDAAIVAEEKSDIELQGLTSGGTAEVSGELDFFLFDN